MAQGAAVLFAISGKTSGRRLLRLSGNRCGGGLPPHLVRKVKALFLADHASEALEAFNDAEAMHNLEVVVPKQCAA